LFRSIVDGVTEAIEQAVDSSVDGKLSWNRGELLDANGNRRTEAYNNNTQEERDAYQYDTDKDMTILKMVDVQDKPIGVFTWWPVHPISFNGGINPLGKSKIYRKENV
jgi:neutral ceramidase